MLSPCYATAVTVTFPSTSQGLTIVVISASFVSQVTLYTGERVAYRYWYLTGFKISNWWYQQLPYIVNTLVPLRLFVKV
jgi:hypothetical protein